MKIKTAVKRKVTIIAIGSLNVKSIAIELKGKYSFRVMADRFLSKWPFRFLNTKIA